ncbi:MAG TPA: SDR family NAD(P)-dependent oxidoreductase [Thermomicrobiales bacterium]|nr:SDR family NAD(P)-dependent oxidoreductase [Thermomicrobiales bacterium]
MGLGRMQGKAVLITGAALGIGRAAAVKFADEGANLVLQDIKPNELATLADQLTANGATVTTIVGDVSREADVQAAVALVIATYGRLDVAIANAGIIPLGDITVSTAADWDHVMSIDGRGMFLTCKYAIQEMLKTGGGAIVCTSSISGVEGQKRQATYGPAKFVASGITKHLAIEWADKGIRVNAVAPGTINTERVQQLPDEPGGAEYLEVIKKAHPMARIGDPSEVADAMLYLASDEASFITGVILPVDGGYLAQ